MRWNPSFSPRRAELAAGWALCSSLLGACVNDVPPTPAPAATASVASAGSAPADSAGSAAPASGAGSVSTQEDFRELIALDWELPPGTEQYLCVRQTLTETLYMVASRIASPLGTHHAVMTVSDQPDGEPDGTSECDGATVGTQNVAGGGVGGVSGKARRLPPGIAIKLGQGGQLILNLHLFNTGEAPLRGRSGIWVQSVDEKDVQVLADSVLATTLKVSVPPGRSTSASKCTFDRDTTIFSVFPHMHLMGVAMKVVAHTAQHGDVVFFDGPYSFDDQLSYPVDMVSVQKGDVVDITCDYENPSANTLHFGESTKDEMCAAGLGRVPRGGPSVCIK
jgi:hypothetical protein